MNFKLVSPYKPAGDQPQAIKKLVQGLREGVSNQVLLGVTGSGKTFTVANLISQINMPTLVISHNKTLAAQLYRDFKGFFPHNAVEYFVSYYDYYQPEAYIPQTDTYIEKDAAINEELDKLRLRATSALMSRKDVIVVASVSCIYNLGSPAEYKELLVELKRGDLFSRQDILSSFVDIQYERNDSVLKRKFFRVKGEIIDIFPSCSEFAYRIRFEDNKISRIFELDPLNQEVVSELDMLVLYPAKHFVTSKDKISNAIESIEAELSKRLGELQKEGKMLQYQRLLSRTRYDIEMLKEAGYCHGIENYSRHFLSSPSGARPFCLIDYFPGDFLTVIDESHVTIPQIRGMHNGDRARKQVLVEHGFRLRSCLDNRPLKFNEFEFLVNKTVFISATPAEYEINKSGHNIVEQIIRPTGLIDPEIEIRPCSGQVDDLIAQIKARTDKNERVLITTLTKKMAEDLSSYLSNIGIKIAYLHSEIDTIARVEVLKKLRLQDIDVIVGVNLLREGLDLPEVSLVAILDADKEGFLRSGTSLIQVAGRAARNINGKVIMYADNITESIRQTVLKTDRRRVIQIEYNKRHNIKPATIQKAVSDYLESFRDAENLVKDSAGCGDDFEFQVLISELYREMEFAAKNLYFERAAEIRDLIAELKNKNKVSPSEIDKISERFLFKKYVYKTKQKQNRAKSKN